MPDEFPQNEPGGSRRRWITPLRKAYYRFLKIRGNPREIALGFALGLFIGMAPIMGLQTLLVLFLATLLKWNKLSAAIGVWITNPLTAPFIYGMNYLTGARIMGLKKAQYIEPEQSITIISKIITKAPDVFFSLIIGGIILGIPVAIIGYYFSYYAVLEYQTDIKRKIAEKKEKLTIRRQKTRGGKK